MAKAATEEEWLARYGDLMKDHIDVARWLESENHPLVRRDLMNLAWHLNALGDALDVAWLAENRVGEPAKKRPLWRRWKKGG